MQTKTEIEKTYWLGLTVDEKLALTALVKEVTNAVESEYITLDEDQAEVLSSMRQSLLNA